MQPRGNPWLWLIHRGSSNEMSKAFGTNKLIIFHLRSISDLERLEHHSPLQPLSHNLSNSGYMLFNKHSHHVAERISSRNNILNALACTSWGQQTETLLMTYKAVGRSIINYATPVWSPNLHDTNYRKIQYTQNEALRIATGCHNMSSIDHLYTEADILKVKEHSELPSAR